MSYMYNKIVRVNPRSHMADIISLATYRTKDDSLPSDVEPKQDEPYRCSCGSTVWRLMRDGIRCQCCDTLSAEARWTWAWDRGPKDGA